MWFFRFAHGQHKCNFHKCLLTWKKHKNKSLAKTNHMVADIIATYHSLVPRLLPRLSAGEEPGYEVNLPSYLSCVFEHWFLVASQMSIGPLKQQITSFLATSGRWHEYCIPVFHKVHYYLSLHSMLTCWLTALIKGSKTYWSAVIIYSAFSDTRNKIMFMFKQL